MQVDGFMMFQTSDNGVSVSGETHDMRYGLGQSALGAAAGMASALKPGLGGKPYGSAFEVITFTWSGGISDYTSGAELMERIAATAQDLPGTDKHRGQNVQKVVAGPKPVQSGLRGRAATPQFQTLRVEKVIDTASPDLYLAWCQRSCFPGAKIIFRKSSGKGIGGEVLGVAVGVAINLAFLEFHLADVFVEKIEWRIDRDTTPAEIVEFSFNAMEINYTPQISPNPATAALAGATGGMADLAGAGNLPLSNIKGWKVVPGEPWSADSLENAIRKSISSKLKR